MLEMNDDLTKMRQATAQVSFRILYLSFFSTCFTLGIALCFLARNVVSPLSTFLYKLFIFQRELEDACY